MSGAGGVVVGIQGSPHDGVTLDWAAQEALARGAGLAVVHLWDAPEAPDQAPAAADDRAVLEAAVGRVRERVAAVPVTAWRIVGDPVPALSQLAAEAELVVLGGASRGAPLRRSLPGRVAAGARRSAVVVRGRPDPAGPVVAGVGTGADAAVLGEAFAQARRRGLPLRALRAYRTPMIDPTGYVPPYDPRPDVVAALEAAVGPWARAYPDVMVECAALKGSPARLLAAVSAGSSLVVVGAGPTGPAAAVLGSVSAVLARRSQCPVVLAC